MTISAADILEGLKARLGQDQIWCSELAFTNGKRRCDFWTLSPWSSKGYLAVAYEIKISKADYRRDSHAKQREARLYSDRFWYVTPPGLLKSEDIPDWAGLMEYDGQRFRVLIEAPFRDKDAPSWQLVVSLIRNSGDIRRDNDPRVAMAEHNRRRAETLQQALEDGNRRYHEKWMETNKLQKRVAELEGELATQRKTAPHPRV